MPMSAQFTAQPIEKACFKDGSGRRFRSGADLQ